MYVLDDYAETLIAPRISMVSGVSQVQVQGAQKYAVRVQVDPDKLHAEGIGLNEVQHGAAELERQRADGPAVRPQRDLQHQGGGPADERRRVQAGRRRLPQRRAGAAGSGRQRHRQRRGQQERVVAVHEDRDRGARSTCR